MFIMVRTSDSILVIHLSKARKHKKPLTFIKPALVEKLIVYSSNIKGNWEAIKGC